MVEVILRPTESFLHVEQIRSNPKVSLSTCNFIVAVRAKADVPSQHELRLLCNKSPYLYTVEKYIWASVHPVTSGFSNNNR